MATEPTVHPELSAATDRPASLDDLNFLDIDRKWRARWAETRAHEVDMRDGRPKYYCLDMFPYPSGSGLHVGHWRGYVISDVASRLKVMEGYNVLHPMGWDSFGLPAENDAIKNKVHPGPLTKERCDNFRRQLQEIGAVYDWSKEFATSDPDYYKWTQWIFVKMFKAGLAYQKEMPINWCPDCKTGLANEEASGGACERCGATVERRFMKQWMLAITKYADRLIDDLDKVDWPEPVKLLQKNWIGRSHGAKIRFGLLSPVDGADSIEVFTTRPDTLFGATYMVIAPEHPLVAKLATAECRAAVEAYVAETLKKSEVDRQLEDREKTGVFTGAFAKNPANGEAIPVWIGDYVLAHYGTGAIMCVPAHDQRDFEFAKRFALPVREVILKPGAAPTADPATAWEAAYCDEGAMVNSGPFDGCDNASGKGKVTAWLAERNLAEATVNYKLRDWIFARQRYWGEPFPIVHCKACGTVPVPEEDLPVRLPYVANYEPTGTGKSPLAAIPEFVNCACPKCGGAAERETDTMPQWAGSCWYFLRYIDPKNAREPFDAELIRKWMPVDLYIGGIEHATLHLLYARFWVKFLFDQGILPFDEPFKRLFNQGIVYRHGAKMSKSKGNVVNPDELVEKYGSDSLRLYELFMGPPDLFCEWNDQGIEGVYRFLKRFWKIASENAGNADPTDGQIDGPIDDLETTKLRHRTVKTATARMRNFQFNTFISLMMEYVNALMKRPKVSRGLVRDLVIMLAPMAPHLCEELFERMGGTESIFRQRWPSYDEALAAVDTVKVGVQVNGKLRDTIELPAGCGAEEARQAACASPKLAAFLDGKEIVKFVYVPDRIVNFVVK